MTVVKKSAKIVQLRPATKRKAVTRPNTQEPSFYYPQPLQQNLLTLLCCNDEVGKTIAEQINPAHFENPYYRDIATRAIRYWGKYKRAPGETHTPDLFSHILDNDDPHKQSRVKAYRNVLFGIFEAAPRANPEYIMDQLRQFSLQQRTKSQILKVAERLTTDTGDANATLEALEGLQPLLDEARDRSSGYVKGKTYKLVNAEDVIIKPTDWVWHGHLARAAQEILTGLPGMGKSQIQCSYVAHVTTGRDWPDRCRGINQPMNVIMVVAEDAFDSIVKPRLLAAGADISRVKYLEAIKQDDKNRSFLLGEDLDALEVMICKYDIGLVTIDPVTAFMGGKINSDSATQVRSQLTPLNELARRTNVAISTLTHPPKHGSQRALDQFIGSQAFIANCRIGHLCLPEMGIDAEGRPFPTGRNLFTHPKHNYSKEKPALAYRIEETIVGKRHEQMEITFVEWVEEVAFTADAAVAATKGGRATPIDDFLRQFLEDGPRWVNDIKKAGARRHYSYDQLWGALRRMRGHHKRIGIIGSQWSLRPFE